MFLQTRWKDCFDELFSAVYRAKVPFLGLLRMPPLPAGVPLSSSVNRWTNQRRDQENYEDSLAELMAEQKEKFSEYSLSNWHK